MNNQRPIYELALAGVAYHHALELIRISRALRRWYERECGTGNGCIERDEKTGLPYWYNAEARYLLPNDPRAYSRIPDLEKGALTRLDKVMREYPDMTAYVQSDPRGCALFIVRPGDLREGQDIETCYDRGIAVY